MPKVLNTTVTINSKGQIVLPKWLRDQKKLSTGSKFKLRIVKDEIILIPYQVQSFIEKWRGSMPEIDLAESQNIEKRREQVLNNI
jgi:AbrB family looped-hinge helix DNA binding protein